MEANAEIIPIAAGKGGVGKTFLAANLAMALAELGHKTIAVDLDLGGSNLHTFLGFPNRHPGIGDYLQAKSAPLQDFLVPTETENLTFLPGDGKTPFMANIPHAQKVKLITQIRKLPAEYVVLDLGAGSAYNALDFFAMSEKGIVVTTPEPPAVMNMLVFLKHHLLRQISKLLSRGDGFQEFLKEHYRRPMESQMASMKVLQEEISREDPEAALKIGRMLASFRPRVIFNLGENPEDMKLVAQIDRSLDAVLSIKAEYFGFVFEDPSVRETVKAQRAFLPSRPESPAAESIARIAKRVEKYWHTMVDDSATRLEKVVRAAYVD